MDQVAEFLAERHVSRSAYVVTTGSPTSIYLAVCVPHDRPVRFEVAEPGPSKRLIPCPESGHLIEGELLVAVTTTVVCDGACMGAFRNFCGCGCGGMNHGKRWGVVLGQSELADSALETWRAARRKVEARREQRAQSAERKQRQTFDDWAADNADLIAALAAHADLDEPSEFLSDLAVQVTTGRNGNGPKALSEGQVSAAVRVLADIARREQLKAERQAAAKPCPEGRIEISGEIMKVVVRGGYAYDSTESKAVVACDGYAVWVTLPRALEDYAAQERLFWKLRDSGEFTDGFNGRGPDFYAMTMNSSAVFKGFKITFTAQVVRSDKDQSFGFAKRPTRVTFEPKAC